ncbi:MAG: hypothetical protein RR665_02575, partial [Malacoplasma sp.]
YFLKEIKIFIINLSQNSVDCKIENSLFLEKNSDIVYLIEKLNRKQRQIINNHISILTENLTVRSRNAVLLFLDAEPNLILLKENVFSKLIFDVNSLKNVGETSIPELNEYFNEIKNFIKEVYRKSDENELLTLEIIFFLKSRFKNLDTSILLDKQSSIFSLVEILIEKNCLLKDSDTIILKNTFKLYNDSVFLTLEDISQTINLTRERVRQIRNSLFTKFINKLQFLIFFDKNTLLKYRLNYDNNSIIINEQTASFINSIDGTNFSKQFITLIISVILQNEFIIVGGIDDVLILKDSNARFRHNWRNIYLIKKEIYKSFEIEKFIEDIYFRRNDRNDETYKFNFKSYLTRFLKNEDYSIFDEIFPFCEKIISEEFSMFLNISEEITFERNTFKTLPEYAYEALEMLGKPSHISAINEQIKILKPDYENEIANTALSKSRGFISFSRTSTFGLKKWELESNTIKGGTIRSIAEEFLLKNDKPMHISDISEYVLIYRPESNEKSILYNLKMEDNNRFLFFRQAFIGLKRKKYNESTLEILDENDRSEQRSWDENYQELINFIEINKRVPSSSNCPPEEIRINKWLSIQRNKINKGILEESKANKMNPILSIYNLRKNKATLFRKEGYDKLVEFISAEKRLPSANKVNESQLYAFFYKQRKLFESGNLDIDSEAKFLEIAKLIQNN